MPNIVIEITEAQKSILEWVFDHWEDGLCGDASYIEDNPDWADVDKNMFIISKDTVSKGNYRLFYNADHASMKGRLGEDLERLIDMTVTDIPWSGNGRQGKLLGTKSAIKSIWKKLYNEEF